LIAERLALPTRDCLWEEELTLRGASMGGVDLKVPESMSAGDGNVKSATLPTGRTPQAATQGRAELHKAFRAPESGLPKLLFDLRLRAGIAKRVVGGLARAVSDGDRLRELWHRLQEYEGYDQVQSAVAAPRKTFVAPASASTPFPLLVSSNAGLFMLERGEWNCLFPFKCFGIARRENTLFIGATGGIHSFVISAEISGKETIEALHDVKILARYEARYHTERIHQIAYDPKTDLIQCANCRRNSLLAVDPNGRGIVDEKFPFVDPRGGSPYFTNQNNLNAVMVNGDALLFTCLFAGEGGALGFIENDTVHIYQYRYPGTHDVVIHDDALMFTDSFRGSVGEAAMVSGAIRYRGEEYLSQGIDPGVRKLVLRGLVMRGNTLVVGFSANSPNREGRMKLDGGGVIVFENEKFVSVIDAPLSQTYDMVAVDGTHSDKPGPVRTATELDAMFRRDVGPLIFEGPLLRNARIPTLR
jgi:hypothetical protein